MNLSKMRMRKKCLKCKCVTFSWPYTKERGRRLSISPKEWDIYLNGKVVVSTCEKCQSASQYWMLVPRRRDMAGVLLIEADEGELVIRKCE